MWRREACRVPALFTDRSKPPGEISTTAYEEAYMGRPISPPLRLEIRPSQLEKCMLAQTYLQFIRSRCVANADVITMTTTRELQRFIGAYSTQNGQQTAGKLADQDRLITL